MSAIADADLSQQESRRYQPVHDPACCHPTWSSCSAPPGISPAGNSFPVCSGSRTRDFSPIAHIVGTSLEEMDDSEFHEFAYEACREFARQDIVDSHWEDFRSRLHFVSQAHGPAGLAEAVPGPSRSWGATPAVSTT